MKQPHKQGYICKEISPQQLIKNRMKEGVCIICGKPKKDEKFAKTNYCSLKHYLES